MIFMETFLIGSEVELEMQQLLWKGKACVSWLVLEVLLLGGIKKLRDRLSTCGLGQDQCHLCFMNFRCEYSFLCVLTRCAPQLNSESQLYLFFFIYFFFYMSCCYRIV